MPSIRVSLLWNAVRTWGSRLLGFLVFFQVARLVSPNELGLFVGAYAVIALGDVLCEQGVGDAVVSKPELDSGFLSAAFCVNVSIAFFAAIALFLCADLLAEFLGQPSVASLIHLGLIILPLNALGMVPQALFRREMRFKELATRSLLSTGASGAVAVVLAHFQFGAKALIIQAIVASLINVGFLWRGTAWRPSFAFTYRDAANVLKSAGPQLSVRLVDLALTRGLELLVLKVFGASSAGVFAIGTKLYQILQQLLGMMFSDVLYASYSRMASAGIFERHREALIRGLVFLVPFWLALYIAADLLIVILFGANWSESTAIAKIFFAIGLVTCLDCFSAAVLYGMRRPGLLFALGCLRLGALALAYVYQYSTGAALIEFLAFYGMGLYLVSLVLHWVAKKLLVPGAWKIPGWLLRTQIGPICIACVLFAPLPALPSPIYAAAVCMVYLLLLVAVSKDAARYLQMLCARIFRRT